MNTTLEQEMLSQADEGPERAGDAPATVWGSGVSSLEGFSPATRSRLVRFIIGSTLGRGAAPVAVAALYADLAGDDEAVAYVDRRFVEREIPPDWREVADRVLDLEESAGERGVDLAAAWGRATAVAVQPDDPLEMLARLAGVALNAPQRANRSIFDDPEDLDALDQPDDLSETEPLEGRLPDLVDLTGAARGRIRQFCIEERLERGLPPFELLELYRSIDEAGDERAHQYLDRVYVEHDLPPDWQELQVQAQRVIDLAESRGRDAGRLFSDVQRASPGVDPVVALQMVTERLRLR